MADWFKFFENGLDEPRLQFAIGTLSEVTPVWLGILSECCRNKNRSIAWNDDEAYLFGFSRRLNVSIPKVNEAVNLLVRIRYIEITNGELTVLKWNDMQSEYMRYKERKVQKTLGTPLGHSRDTLRVEEKRGEKIRAEEKREEKKDPPLALVVPDKLQTPEFLSSWNEWQSYRKELKGVKNWPALFKAQMEQLSKFDPPTATEMLNQSRRNGWKGIFEIRTNQINGIKHHARPDHEAGF